MLYSSFQQTTKIMPQQAAIAAPTSRKASRKPLFSGIPRISAISTERVHQAGFADVEVWVEIGEGGAEFFDFGGGAADFEAGEIGEFEEFSEQLTDVA